MFAQGYQRKYESEALPGEKNPALLVELADSGGSLGHTKPTQSYPLVLVPVITFVVVILAVVAVADFGDDLRLSY
jgi:hypothetical protein